MKNSTPWEKTWNCRLRLNFVLQAIFRWSRTFGGTRMYSPRPGWLLSKTPYSATSRSVFDSTNSVGSSREKTSCESLDVASNDTLGLLDTFWLTGNQISCKHFLALLTPIVEANCISHNIVFSTSAYSLTSCFYLHGDKLIRPSYCTCWWKNRMARKVMNQSFYVSNSSICSSRNVRWTQPWKNSRCASTGSSVYVENRR
jgi:hypothetical protein